MVTTAQYGPYFADTTEIQKEIIGRGR